MRHLPTYPETAMRAQDARNAPFRTVKRLTWYLLLDAIAEAWERHDPQLLAGAYRAATLTLEA